MGVSKKSLCWKCKNFSQCSWARGKPVKYWRADKVQIKNEDDSIMDSYFVHECPKYIEDDIIEISTTELEELTGLPRKVIINGTRFNRYSEELYSRLKSLGYEFARLPGESKLFIKKLNKKGEIENGK